MRFLVSFGFLAGATLLAACSGGTSSTHSTGGGAGAGGDTTTASDGGGGSAGSTTTDSMTDTTTDTTTTTTTDTTTTTTTTTSAPADPCDSAGSTPVSFANDVQPIFSANCGTSSSCHLGSFPSEGLSLKVGKAYASLVNVPAKQKCNGQVRVQPGSATGSYIVNKITDTDVCPLEKKMPPGGLLSVAKRQTIIDWICQGAMDN